jgi:signal transduction histidine kinase/CheY-like chemotaxis protein
MLGLKYQKIGVKLTKFTSLLLLLFALVAKSSAQPPQVTTSSDLLLAGLRAWVEQLDRPIRVGFESTFRPYAFYDDNGRASGIAGDYLALLSERLKLEFEVVQYGSFTELVTASQNRDIDLVPFISPTADRRKFLNFSRAVYLVFDRLFTRSSNTTINSINDLKGVNVGMIEGYVGDAELFLQNSDAILHLLKDEQDAVEALALGSIDALIANVGSVSYYTQQLGVTNIKIAAEFSIPDPQTFAVRNDWAELMDIVNIGLASITEGEINEIENRWVNIAESDTQLLEAQIESLVTVLVVIVALVSLIFVWVLTLRRQVNIRTQALHSELQLRRKIEAEKTRLVAAIDQSAEFVLIADEDKNIQYANRAVLAINKQPMRKDAPVQIVAVEEDKTNLVAAISQLQTGGSWRGRIRLASDQNDPVSISVNITKTMDEIGNINYILTGRDISAEEELEARLRQGEKVSALGTLAGGIAHDFNNLLVPILGLTDLLETSANNSSAVAAIRTAALRGQQLVQRILTFSRLNAESEFEIFNASEEAAESVTFLRSLIPTTIHIHIDVNIAENLFIKGSKSDLQQILLNLGTNASDAMPTKSGKLSIKLDRCRLEQGDPSLHADLAGGDYVRLTVADYGQGMDLDQQNKMFDPYFTSKPLGKGTGLGLATVHGLVESHGGGIRVTSSKSKGTTIEVFLPIATQSCERPPKNLAEPVAIEHNSKELVVDDDVLVLETVGKMLEYLGYTVELVNDPQQALEMLTRKPAFYSLMLSDYTMPKMTGEQLAKQAKAQDPKLAIVLMTGASDHIESLQFHTLSKPFGLELLSAALKTEVARARTIKTLQ